MYNFSGIKQLLVDNKNAILYKELNEDIVDAEKIIVSHSIVYVLKGTVKVMTYDYDELSISEGEILFMPRDSYLISDYLKDNEQLKVYLFFFDYTLALEFLKNVPKNDSKLKYKKNNILKLNSSKNILNYINSLSNINYTNINNKHLLYSKIFELLHLLSEVNNVFIGTLFNEEMKSHNRDIETYMLEHYDKNLSINDWASLQGVSISTFNRKFKKQYNISPKQWILKQNMIMAHTMLKDGKSVSQCAIEFSYSNTSNFIKAYKEIYKITPKQHIKTLS